MIDVVLRYPQQAIQAGLLNLLIKHDPKCARIELRGDDFWFCNGGFLLHRACVLNAPSDIIELLLQLHPEALLAVDNNGDIPISLLLKKKKKISFDDRHIENFNLVLRYCPTLAVYTDKPPLQLALTRQVPTEMLEALIAHSPEIADITDDHGDLPF